jgi:hypothetical protein
MRYFIRSNWELFINLWRISNLFYSIPDRTLCVGCGVLPGNGLCWLEPAAGTLEHWDHKWDNATLYAYVVEQHALSTCRAVFPWIHSNCLNDHSSACSRALIRTVHLPSVIIATRMLKTSLIIFFVFLAVGLTFLIAVSSSVYPLFDFAGSYYSQRLWHE